MFSFEFESWSDILLGHYLLTLFISIIAVVVTFIISKKHNFETRLEKNKEQLVENEDNNLKTEYEKITTTTCDIKRSPALVAENVIKANMTEEQRLLEYQVRQRQLAQIYELMQKQSDKFGNISLSEVEEQMKLYQ